VTWHSARFRCSSVGQHHQPGLAVKRGANALRLKAPVIERALSVDGSVTAWRFFGASLPRWHRHLGRGVCARRHDDGRHYAS
jgi:hypothetical protein